MALKRILFVFSFLISFHGFAAEVPKLVGKPVHFDMAGNLVPWIEGPSPYDQVMKWAWDAYLYKIPKQWNGLESYYTYPRFKGSDNELEELFNGVWWAHNPACLNAMTVDSAIAYAAYTGSAEPLALARRMFDYHVAHGMTPKSWNWAEVPFASSNPGEKEYRGGEERRFCTNEEGGCGRGDGVGFIEPDKVGDFGEAALKLYKLTLDLKYIKVAVQCADALAKHVRVGDENHSPWPFRVDGETGKKIKEQYTSHLIGAIGLFDGLEELVGFGSGEQRKAWANARALAWNWLERYPLKNGYWQGYFEDIPVFEKPGQNPNQISPLETARYFLLHPERIPGGLPRAIREAQTILDWTVRVLGADAPETVNGYEAGIQFGAQTISEQYADMEKMSSHTARYASVLALLYESTNDPKYREQAYRSFNWATYFVKPNGVVQTSISEVGGYWFSDGYADFMRHFQYGMASVPEWAPSGESHFLRSTSVIQNVKYVAKNKMTYRSFESVGRDVVKVPAPVNSKLRVLGDEGHPKFVANWLDDKNAVITIDRKGQRQVTITW